MTVETVKDSHLQAVASLEKLCFHEPWSASALQLLLTEQATGAVCLEDGAVVAYGGMLWAPDEGQITNIAVLPDARRHGYGSAVLRELLNRAKERNCAQISLEVRESNVAAIALYERFGFAVAGRRKHFYRQPSEDALVMICRLNEE
ncbi:MAG: ribosomal protein S18-alanine N-acetyltransferase [Clostridia bacterium]|nr:ribosomal protein S18-alanine N-acetyltransferase [Clostridia bacterium]